MCWELTGTQQLSFPTTLPRVAHAAYCLQLLMLLQLLEQQQQQQHARGQAQARDNNLGP